MFASIVTGALLFVASAHGQASTSSGQPRCTEVCFVEPCAPCSPAATDMMSILPISTSASGDMSILPISTGSSSQTDIIVTRPGPPTGNPSGTSGVLSIPAGETPIGDASTVVPTTTSVSSGSTSRTPTASSSSASSSAPNAGVPAPAVDAGVLGAMLGFAWALL